MKSNIRVHVDYNPHQEDITIHVVAPHHTQDVDSILRAIQSLLDASIVGENIQKERIVLPLMNIVRIYTNQKAVYATVDGVEYRLDKRLYELEQMLPTHFVRTSHSEIVNIYHIASLNCEFPGTIRILLNDDTIVFVSRRYIKKVNMQITEVLNYE